MSNPLSPTQADREIYIKLGLNKVASNQDVIDGHLDHHQEMRLLALHRVTAMSEAQQSLNGDVEVAELWDELDQACRMVETSLPSTLSERVAHLSEVRQRMGTLINLRLTGRS